MSRNDARSSEKFGRGTGEPFAFFVNEYMIAFSWYSLVEEHADR
jgi:hypothetical protein